MTKYFNFEVNTKETLTMFLSLVWGVFVSLGGGFIYISKINYEEQIKFKASVQAISEKIKGIAIILLFHTLLFIFLSLIYPLKAKVIELFSLEPSTVKLLASCYDSLLYTEIFIPGFFAVLIGVWCIILTVNKK